MSIKFDIIDNKFLYQLDINDIKKYFGIQGFEDSFEKYYLSEEYFEKINKKNYKSKKSEKILETLKLFNTLI